MKRYLFLFLFFWNTCFILTSFSLASEAQNLDEYLIKTKDQKCVLRYLSPIEVPPDWYIYISDDSCLEKGFHEVHILDTTQVVRDSLSGYFSDSYFIGSTPLMTPILKRFSSGPGVQSAYYLIEQNKHLSIDFIGVMTSQVQNLLYPAFNICEPFHIIAFSSNKTLFGKEETLENIITVVKSHAQNICPGVSTIIFEALDKNNQNKAFFLSFHLEKKPDGSWLLIPEKSFNKLMLEKEALSKKQNFLKEIYSLLEKLPPYDRPAFLFNQFKIDFPYHLAVASSLLKMPVKGVFILHVNQKNQDTSWGDYPFPLKITPPLETGWYLVKAQIQPFSIQEKKKAGIPLKNPAAHITLIDQKKCSRENCSEWEETSYLIEQKYNVPYSFFMPSEIIHEK